MKTPHTGARGRDPHWQVLYISEPTYSWGKYAWAGRLTNFTFILHAWPDPFLDQRKSGVLSAGIFIGQLRRFEPQGRERKYWCRYFSESRRPHITAPLTNFEYNLSGHVNMFKLTPNQCHHAPFRLIPP